jgi:hypothetical protein
MRLGGRYAALAARDGRIAEEPEAAELAGAS